MTEASPSTKSRGRRDERESDDCRSDDHCSIGSWIICRRRCGGGNGCTASRRQFCRQRACHSRNAGPHCRKKLQHRLLIDDIREELRGRPYDLVAVAGGWKHLTRPAHAGAIRSAFGTAVGGNERAGRPDAVGRAGADVHRPSPADYAWRVVVFFWERDFSRPDQPSARHEADRFGPAQPNTGRALHLRHHKRIPAGVRARHAAICRISRRSRRGRNRSCSESCAAFINQRQLRLI